MGDAAIAGSTDGDSANVTGVAHCCAPRWIGHIPPPLGRNECTTAGLCGTCCVARPGTPPASNLPCDPSLPVLIEGARSALERDPSEHVSSQIIGDSFPVEDRAAPGALSPPDLVMSMGAYAKYMYMVPSTQTLVVSMGLSFGKSLGCIGGYDDSFTLSLIWRALAKALLPTTNSTDTDTDAVADAEAAGTEVDELARAAGSNVSELDVATDLVEVHLESKQAEETAGGSCRCYCPPGQGFGLCRNRSSTQPQRCDNVPAPGDTCPGMGVVLGCVAPADTSSELCATAELTAWQRGHGFNCTQSRRCTALPGATSLATAACACVPATWSGCEWSAESCPWDSPYFPSVTKLRRKSDDSQGGEDGSVALLAARLDSMQARFETQVQWLQNQVEEQSRAITALRAVLVQRPRPPPETTTTSGNFRQEFAEAINRTFLSKARDVVDVRDFGALCSGSSGTDDAPGVQAAIDSGASRINFPEGTCLLRSTVVVAGKAGLMLIGSCIFQTVLQGPGGAANVLEFVNRTSRVRMADLSLHGNHTSGAALYIGSTTPAGSDTGNMVSALCFIGLSAGSTLDFTASWLNKPCVLCTDVRAGYIFEGKGGGAHQHG